VIGRAIVLDGHSYTVVGVMPAKFQFPIQNDPVDLWTTMAIDVAPPSDGGKSMGEQRGAHYLRVVARLNPGVSVAQAQSELGGVQARLDRQYPDNRPSGINIVPEKERIVGKVHDTLLVLLGAVGFVLLIACANLANLLLTRATARQKEIGIRTALGASRAAILRQLLTESVLLALLGGAFGLLLAFWSNKLLVGFAAKSLPRVAGVGIDGRVLAFTALVAIACGVIFGLFPALQISHVKLNRTLNDAGRAMSEGAHQGRLRGALVVSEIALALVLLIGSGLLIQTLFRLQRVDPGFRKDQLVTFELYLPDARYPDAKIPPFYRDLIDRIRALPGVQAASGAFGLPFAPNNMSVGFDIAGHPVPTTERDSADTKIVALDYFRTMGIPLIAGREFGEQDTAASTPVMMINQAFAKKYFPNENPVGQHVKPGIGFGKDQSKMREVIGVVGNVSPGDLSAPPEPQVYLASAQGPINDINVIVRTSLPLESILPELRDQVHALDKDLPLLGVKTMEAYVDESIAQPRLDTLLLGIFAGLAFVLTAVGLYGVISYSVAQRTREMGIRMALGAQRGSILKIVLHQGVRMALIGVAIGLCGALALTRLISSMLYGVKAIDAVTFLCVAVLLFAIAMLASYIPALRATRIDPVVALRWE
jgi:putative ABC transport system permease protein